MRGSTTKRVLTVLIAVTAVVALSAPAAQGQEALGFEIDSTEGFPGDVVNGQVDTADVAANCTTELEDFSAMLLERTETLLEFVYGVPVIPPVLESDEDVGMAMIGIIALGALFDPAIGAQIQAQTFLMTFADIATQQPMGPRGSFDPDTGEGSMVVPDLEPGLWAVAAACVSPSVDPAAMSATVANAAAIAAGTDFSQFGFSEPFPTTTEMLLAALEGGAFTEYLQGVGPQLLEPWMAPDALGAQIYCILDADGVCPPGEEPPPGTPGNGGGAAQPVGTSPRFTG